MSGEPWSPINEEGQSYLANKEQERCDKLRRENKYAERTRDTNWDHEMVKCGNGSWLGRACKFCDVREFSTEAHLHDWCPTKITRALEQAALEAEVKAFEFSLHLFHGSPPYDPLNESPSIQALLNKGRARLAELERK